MPNGGVKQVIDMPTPTRNITEIEREQIKKLKKSKNKLMLDE